MQSLQGHLDTLTAAWQALSNSFLSSDFLSGALEGLTSFLSGLDAVINKVGVLPTLIGGITAALSVKNVGIFKTIEDEASASAQGSERREERYHGDTRRRRRGRGDALRG